MLKLIVLALVSTAAVALSDQDWTVYKAKYNKHYTPREEVLRRLIWEDAHKKIDAHNKLYAEGKSTHYEEVNEFADMTKEEFLKTMTGYRVPKDYKLFTPDYPSGKYRGILPDTVDWRSKGYVTPVKNQGQCGSCWAFSTTGSLEGQHFNKTGVLVSLSESNLVDCAGSYGTEGCRGGWMDDAFKYVIGNRGIDTEASYPYYPMQRYCYYRNTSIGATAVSFRDVLSGSEDELQKAVATVGPVSVAIDANPLMYYRGGVLDAPSCGSTIAYLDHGVLVVGYGTDQGKEYWLVKNSWGNWWGEKGYVRMSRNKNNQCGIATKASYPIE